MKSSKSIRVISVLLLAVVFVLSACQTAAPTSQPSAATTSEPSAAASAQPTTEATTAAASAPATDANAPLGKYDPPITITVGRSTNSAYKFIDGESFDNNIWVTEYKDALGIDVKNAFVVDDTQYDAKVNVVIASGDIPDIMMVSAKQTKMMMDSDLIHDITAIFDQYASPMTKAMMTSDAKTMSASKIDGKLMGIPMVWAVDFQVPLVWVRSDWMKKLNLSAPKTADDVYAIANAFVDQDPDGNGQKDTVGISLDKGLSGGVGDIRGLLNMHHAYKSIWVKDASGNLVYGSIQPEMKAALAKMQQLYKDGIIDQEFAVKDGGKIAQDVVAEKTGIEVGLFWNPAWPFQDLKNKNANSDWTPYPLTSVDDKPALAQANVKIDQFFVISKKNQNPEALVKLCNLGFENLYGARSSDWAKIAMSDKYKDIQTFKYPIINIEPPTLNRDMFTQVQDCLDNGNDESKLILQAAKDDYAAGMKFVKDGDNKGWLNYKIRFDKQGGMAVLKNTLDAGNLMYNEFYGLPGVAAIEKGAAMDKLENEVFTKIIMGSASIDEFDTFVQQWKKIGGDEVTAEVNAWYATVK